MWECPEIGLACEEFPDGIKAHVHNYIFRFSTILSRTASEYRRFKKLWPSLVIGYTKLNLSRPDEDKLAAIGGVAESVAEVLRSYKDSAENVGYDPGQYIAGMFREDLLSQLGWEAIEAGRRTNAWRAPSWSWACLDVPVRFDQSLGEDMVKLEDTRLELVDVSNPYGTLRAASLTLRGRIVRIGSARISHSNGGANHHILDGNFEIDWSFDRRGEMQSFLPLGSSDFSLPDCLLILPLRMTEATGPNAAANTRSLKAMLAVPAEKRGYLHYQMIYGLVLFRHNEHTYRRVGKFRHTNNLELLDFWAAAEEESITLV